VLRTARDDRGTVMIEFAFILPLLLTLVLGIMSFGRALNYWINETQLASEGARWAVVDRSPSGSLQSWIKSQPDAQQLKNDMRVEISYPNGQLVGQPVTVKTCVVFNLGSWFAWVPGGANKKIVGSATMRVEQINDPPNVTAGGVGPGTC
jgi:TadE-like protein